MRILLNEEMTRVSGGGGLDSPGKSDANYGGSRASASSSHGAGKNNGRPSNSGWGERAGSVIGGLAGSVAAGAIAPGVSVAKALGGAWGKLTGGAIGNTVENGFVSGANAAIDKALHDAQNASGRAAAGSSRWGNR